MSEITGIQAALRGIPIVEQTIPALLERQAAAYADQVLVRAGDAEHTFAGMRDAAARWGGTLRAHGVGPGDRVAMICGNRMELVELFLGCAWIRAIAVPLNTAARGPQLEHMLANSAPRFLMVEAEFAPALESITLPDDLGGVWLLDGGGLAVVPSLAVAVTALPQPGEPVDAALVGPGDTAAIVYTSGTTGLSKGVCCPQAQWYWWGIQVIEALGIREGDVLLSGLPLFHTNALSTIMQALLSGSTACFVPRFSVSRFWDQAREHRATVVYLLGAMMNFLYNRPLDPRDRDHDIRVALAAATPAALHAGFQERFGFTTVDGYGSTETNHVLGAPIDEQRAGYMGVVVEDYEVDLVDEYDVSVPDGTPGELVVRPKYPFSTANGYFRMPDKTVEAWRNMWFHSGDRAIRDPDGWIRFMDRSKDSIRRRGENISSVEVEQVLLTHPAVQLAAVFPVPSEFAEDEVMATVVLAAGQRLDPEDLVRHCEGSLAYFAIPRYVDVMPELPVTENGKVRKQALRDRGVTDSTWDRQAPG